MPGSGVIANVVAVLMGSAVGLVFGRFITERFRKIAFAALGLSTFSIGTMMVIGGLMKADAAKSKYAVLVLVGSLVIGGLLGEAIGVEAALERFGQWLRSVAMRIPIFKAAAGEGEHQMVEGFVVASLLYCVGTMTIVGSLQDGLGDPNLLYLKALLDGVASIALASALGIGVAFSIIPILIVQGGIALGAGALAPFLTEAVIREMSTVGGTLILAIGIDLMDIKRLPVGNLMPAVFVAGILGAFFG
ncbi:MAG: DUF554 domain-containing protein [Coriobacteriia bacterium]|nr:DUF554 domain-containing protein [Coriobacteriia bacterium]